MSTVKTKIDPEKVLQYLKEHFDSSIESVAFITGGESSQAFSFCTDAGDFIIRVNTHSSNGFHKDAYAFDHFATHDIPIPKIIEIGNMDETYYFAISRMAHGATINKLPDDEYQKTLPDLLRILDAVHDTDIRDTSGYGKWDSDGIAPLDSWKEFVLSVGEHVQKDDLFKNSFLEKDVWEKLFGQMEKLVESCPEDRYLVHGDYGNNNATAENGKVAGIFDWAEALYGDFVYDIAWLAFWQKDVGKRQALEDYYAKRGIPNFAERLLCYKLRIGLGSISFYAYSKQEEKYERIKERTLNLMQ